MVSLDAARTQFVIDNVAFVFFGIAWYAFSAGLLRSIRFIREDSRKPVLHLCALQCALGLVATGLYTSAVMPAIPASCTLVMQLSHACYSLSYLCIISILLIKSYCANRRSRSVLVVGSFILILNAAVLAFAAETMRVEETPLGCMLSYSTLYNIIRLTVDLATNLFLSISILAAVWQQTRNTEWVPDARALYRLLLQDGLIYGLTACSTAGASAVIALHDWMDGRTSIAYATNWVIASTLVVYQLHSARTSRSQTRLLMQQTRSTTSTPLQPTLGAIDYTRPDSAYTRTSHSRRSTIFDDWRLCLPDEETLSLSR
ncbi:hypothetical protein THASP1DRAFT_33245 [Thamnocephalis sphaerospora]|uniref:G-protein coupled receptors family 3 profile domain-containing protein n=1 Tax=Thamnocephalis sphaerospora TaxID=78915 RepID=A0A4P9XH04_9FUNG|nr:hypothetical protein THASP1DRAFT_33245 [Thamnocephalis sphaerospora]|eukprot:RKP04933.1 hypothetical protein THASP1DRAFT_33245 [Thamnocephalis sphaerospora]